MTIPAVHFSTHWYEVVNNQSLRQGDLFRDLLVFWLPQDLAYRQDDPISDEDRRIPLEYTRGDWIVTSASCDVDHSKYPQVLLTRVLPATREYLGEQSDKSLAIRLEVLRKGFDVNHFLLAECEAITPALPRSFAQYKVHALVPIEYLRRNCLGPRLRLKHPHRERFGAWAGACLSRVGAEDDTQIPHPDRKVSTYPADVLRANEAS